MTSKHSEQTSNPPATSGTASGITPLKIVVAGGFASGKTTFVDSISEITPLRTEAPMTNLSVGVDNLGEVSTKTTTTVAMDFGRMSLSETRMLYLFGTPGQDRFWFMWDELTRGSVGSVVLVDTRRFGDCFAPVEYFEKAGRPFVVAINTFDGQTTHQPEEVREALDIDASVPITLVDARDAASVKAVLVTLVKHAISQKQ